MRIWKIALFMMFASGSAQAREACKEFNLRYERQYNCPDGSIKKIEVASQQLIVRTFHPETKQWTEERFRVSEGITLDSINVSVMLNHSVE
ncbi:MAG: hypothetical protein RLZZ488_583 [Pseudomonadota bacterium]|jgi:hypothetical protein